MDFTIIATISIGVLSLSRFTLIYKTFSLPWQVYVVVMFIASVVELCTLPFIYYGILHNEPSDTLIISFFSILVLIFFIYLIKTTYQCIQDLQQGPKRVQGIITKTTNFWRQRRYIDLVQLKTQSEESIELDAAGWSYRTYYSDQNKTQQVSVLYLPALKVVLHIDPTN
jgi:hypothetical protein